MGQTKKQLKQKRNTVVTGSLIKLVTLSALCTDRLKGLSRREAHSELNVSLS